MNGEQSAATKYTKKWPFAGIIIPGLETVTPQCYTVGMSFTDMDANVVFTELMTFIKTTLHEHFSGAEREKHP